MAGHLDCENLLQNDEVDIEKIIQDKKMLEKVKKSSEIVAELIDNVIITLGSTGILLTRKNTSEDSKFFDASLRYNQIKSGIFDLKHRFYAANKLSIIKNVSGAGDSFSVGFITAMLNNLREDVCVSVGMESAKAALQSHTAVPDRYFDRNHECFSKPTPYETV